MDEQISPQELDYQKRVGQRLRAVRRQKGYSLQEVEARSDLEFKASVLGAYERGERAISVARLHRLAGFYGVPTERLLPSDPVFAMDAGRGGPTTVASLTRGDERLPVGESVTIDLNRLADLDEPDFILVARYLRMIQTHRQSFDGATISIRRGDLRIIASLVDSQPELLRERLEQLGVLVSSGQPATA